MNYTEEKQMLENSGFTGFVTIASLMSNINVVPAQRGVYAVMRANDDVPKFLATGTGGFFKGEDPNVGLDVLKANWVDDTSIVYFGKAGGTNKKSTLRSRLAQYMEFGQGKAVGHKGGRYIWQLSDAEDLVVCWKTISGEEPRDVEKQLIAKFKLAHGFRRPFANLQD